MTIKHLYFALIGLGVFVQPLQAQNLSRAIFPALLKSKRPLSVAARSAQINRAAIAQLRAVTQTQSAALATTHIPQELKSTVFEVQHTSYGRSTATAFALEINGKVWGVTAGHVMANIKSAPYAKIQNMLDKTILAPIEFWGIGNPNGNDLAIFEIPDPIRPFVKVLKPLETPAQTGEQTQSPCFVKGNPTFLPAEKIVFAGQHRVLLEDNAHQEMSGYCGSPVLIDGKVAAIHVGSFSQLDARTANWSHLFDENKIPALPAVHVASPVNRVIELTQAWELPYQDKSLGSPLKVMGQTIAQLHPQEQLYSIQLIRNESLQKTIHAHPFMHFDRLEEFFELQENDTLRVTVLHPKTILSPAVIHVYDINVSTGKITHTQHKA